MAVNIIVGVGALLTYLLILLYANRYSMYYDTVIGQLRHHEIDLQRSVIKMECRIWLKSAVNADNLSILVVDETFIEYLIKKYSKKTNDILI